MRKSRFSEEQIVRRSHISTMSDATFYKWKARYGGLQNRRLKPGIGEQAEEAARNHALLAIWQKTSKPASRREQSVLCRDYQFSTRRACGLIGFSRSSTEEGRIAMRGYGNGWSAFRQTRRYGYRMLHANLARRVSR